MTITISAERPDTSDACALIAELEAALAPLYPSENQFAYSVEKLIQELAFTTFRRSAIIPKPRRMCISKRELRPC